MHNTFAKQFRRYAQESGVEAEPEAVCPELLQGAPGAKDSKEARLDVHLWGHRSGIYEEWGMSPQHTNGSTQRRTQQPVQMLQRRMRQSNASERGMERVSVVSNVRRPGLNPGAV